MDIGFVNSEGRFRYRAAAIIIEDGFILMAHNEKDPYYYSIGGAVHMNETSEDAVKREVYEETGIEYEVDHLAFIHENFFLDNNANNTCHEIAFYYFMKPRGIKKINNNSYTRGVKEDICFLPINELEKYILFPAFYRRELQSLNTNLRHIVTIDVRAQ